MKKQPRALGPGSDDLRNRLEMNRLRSEVQKLRRGKAASEAASEAAAEAASALAAEPAAVDPDSGATLADADLTASILQLRSEITDLSNTKNRLSRLYFQHLELSRQRATRLQKVLRGFGGLEGEGDGLLQRIALALRDHLGFERARLWAREGERYRAVASAGLSSDAGLAHEASDLALGEVASWFGEVESAEAPRFLRHDDPMRLRLPGPPPVHEARPDWEWNSGDALLVPVIDPRGERVACMALEGATDGLAPSAETFAMIGIAVRHAALAIETARLKAALERARRGDSPLGDRLRELLAERIQLVEFRPPVSGDADPAPAVGERSRQRSSFLNRVEQTLLTSGFGRADLATVLQEAAIELGPLADARHITLKLQNAVADTEIEASHDLLREVMLHLGRNAIEFTPPSGTVCLKLSADARDLMLEVDDTGIGIDPARLKDLFDPFRRTQAPDGNQGELAGVRLAMCRRIVGWHGGRLFIESSGTRGTRAYVILPREAARREPRGAGKQSEVLPIGGTASS